ncbi:hypothetical protein DF119_34850 [Burkholderia stagnalis]|nr:hypothetical protein DF119_34850 [Burkholderia stagnalis]
MADDLWMIIDLNETRIRTVEPVRAILDGTETDLEAARRARCAREDLMGVRIEMRRYQDIWSYASDAAVWMPTPAPQNAAFLNRSINPTTP